MLRRLRRHGTVWSGRVRRGKGTQAWQGRAGQGRGTQARRGAAWQGRARNAGGVRIGPDWSGEAGLGTAGHRAQQFENCGAHQGEMKMNKQPLTAWQVFCFFGALVCVVWMLLHYGVIGR